MNRNKAYWILSAIIEDAETEPYSRVFDEDDVEALRMAAELLRQEPVIYPQVDGITPTVVRQEPCEDAVSRQAVLDAIDDIDKTACMNEYHAIVKAIEDLPSVTPKPKTGYWEMCEDADGIYGVCDICGTDADFSHYGKAYPYCPNCGAKMESEERA